MPISFVRVLGAAALFVLASARPLAAQRTTTTTAARDSATLERQARQIARLDSALNALRREVRGRAADSVRAAPQNGPALVPFHLGGLLQVWYAQGDGGFQNTFRVRRAELKLTGDVSPRSRWAITIDPARLLSTSSTTTDVNGSQVLTAIAVNQSSRILVDALLALALPAHHELDVGQFKLPIGFEGGVQSVSTLETIERALYTSDRTRGGIYGDSRDIGVMLRSPAEGLEYMIGFFNGVGESQNDTDRNGAKAMVGRVVAHMPVLHDLALGASGAFTTRGSPDSLIHRRAGAEARLVLGPVLVKSEYMSGHDGTRRGEGWFAHVGYSPIPHLTLLARRDVFDPDVNRETSVLDAREQDWVGGFTYDIPAFDLRLQMNYLRKTLPPAIAPSRNLLLTNLQAAW
jgi:hypothetical protein